jgi:glycolate dehydrogenase FAD-linked subunit
LEFLLFYQEVDMKTLGEQPGLKDEFRSIVGTGRYYDNPEELLAASYDAYIEEALPEAVIFPKTPEEIASVLKVANREAIPVTGRGAGTCLSGGAFPARGGLVLNFTRMNRILEINTRGRYAVVQPGVVNMDLQKALAAMGFFYPPDPSSCTVSTIGGNIAENAGGPRCLKYGVTGDYILGLEVVLASGQVIRSGSRNVKDVTGYNLSTLFCGSEGTLGIVSEATLKILPLPEAQRTAQVFYDDLQNTAETVSAIIAAGILPAALELMDNFTINVTEDSAKLGLPRDAAGMLIIQVDGPEESVHKEMQRILKIARANGAVAVKAAETEAQSEELWTARRAAYGIFARISPYVVVEDATVPVNNVPKMVVGTRRIADQHGLKMGIIAHAGDGNLHPVIAADMRDKDEWRRVKVAIKEIFELAVSLGGTLTGEHGIGSAKTEFLPLVMDRATRELTATIKKALDPKGILNPGKFV